MQIGGPSGGCIPADLIDLPIDYEQPHRRPARMMGSGGMVVMDDSTCMVDVARYFMEFLEDESCGQCFPCRKGTQRMKADPDPHLRRATATEERPRRCWRTWAG